MVNEDKGRAMTTGRVVNVKSGEPYDVYIGRQNPRYKLKRSKWANPFKLGQDGTREEIMARYEAWIQTQPELLADLPELRGKTLGCWCAPELCHGDILLRLAEEAE
jgi:hypothetical protein